MSDMCLALRAWTSIRASQTSQLSVLLLRQCVRSVTLVNFLRLIESQLKVSNTENAVCSHFLTENPLSASEDVSLQITDIIRTSVFFVS